ncbi:MAG TPA: hypothetical protein VM166_05335 [Gemmatimonadaceae bacterium]|nr:hypothetical protein [Gemmatimonadaceae bacterium]
MENRFGQRVVHGAIVTCVTAVLAVTGCTSSTGPAARVKIVPANKTVAVQTNSAGFSSIQVPITITNTSSQVIAYDPCSGFLEQNTGEGWRVVYSQICAIATVGVEAGGTSPPLLMGPNLAPGESATFTLVVPVTAQPVGREDSSIRGAPGEYRVRVLIVTEFLGQVVTLPHDASVSESFSIVAP